MSAWATPDDDLRTTTRPTLRLVHGTGAATAPARSARPAQSASPEQSASPALHLVQEDPPDPQILIAAGDPDRRADVREELAGALAEGTVFGEAGSTWEVLRQAPESGVVMLAGDLEDASMRTLTRLLAQRHPRLPIVVLDGPSAD